MSIDKQFEAFHEANPQVYEALRTLALGAIRAGRTKIGAKALWERMRWDMWIATTEKAPRLNNNYCSRYARLLMLSEPELSGAFDIRTLRNS